MTAAPDIYRGWTIHQGRWPEPAWSAVSPNYDAWTEGEGEWADNGEKAEADTRAALLAEIDAWLDDQPAPVIPLRFGLGLLALSLASIGVQCGRMLGRAAGREKMCVSVLISG